MVFWESLLYLSLTFACICPSCIGTFGNGLIAIDIFTSLSLDIKLFKVNDYFRAELFLYEFFHVCWLNQMFIYDFC